jgi:hypothetical protein
MTNEEILDELSSLPRLRARLEHHQVELLRLQGAITADSEKVGTLEDVNTVHRGVAMRIRTYEVNSDDLEAQVRPLGDDRGRHAFIMPSGTAYMAYLHDETGASVVTPQAVRVPGYGEALEIALDWASST